MRDISKDRLPNDEDIPSNWEKIRAGDLITLEYGDGLPKRERNSNGDIPVYGSNGITGHHNESITEEECLIIGRKGSAGEVTKADKPCWPIDTTYYVIPPESLNIDYLNHYLSFLRLDLLDKSTAVPSLSRDDVYEETILVPPLEEQKRIVSKIEELFTQLDSSIADLGDSTKRVELFEKSLFDAAAKGKLSRKWRSREKGLNNSKEEMQKIREEKGEFEDKELLDFGLHEIPKKWTWTQIGEFADVKGGKRLPKGHTLTKKETDYPYLRVKDMEHRGVDKSELKYLEPETREEIKKYTISSDDLFISIAGTIGKVGTIPEELDGINLTENAAKITDIHGFDKKYLSYVLYSSLSREQIRRYSRATNQPKLALFRTKQVRLPRPPLEEQKYIAKKLDSIISNIDYAGKSIEDAKSRADKLRQSILKKAFRGELVPQKEEDSGEFNNSSEKSNETKTTTQTRLN
ncbi:MAG: restriction endonuclease subunit S [Candidatus Nanohaloarchaea archaeon]